ncbi:MAG: hypothetical protein ABIC91_08620 [Nanoarchaeota archaeon]|nr:hypothetical protein [Nanoarchaeota archaeon]MBU1030301.1 hypothetical protein [Nanoarchaeota archaeon]MBU1849314.1 hypothetical protein [Nanoarchaeota archaeon]
MNRINSLSELKKSDITEIILESLPRKIQITEYAKDKAYEISKLVRQKYYSSYEWYSFTIANKDNPELIIDVGLGKNDQNLLSYCKITPENIDKFRELLSDDLVINGWLHSHGNLNFRHFSGTDDNNQITVLRYVYSLLKKPIMKKEILIKDLSLLVANEYTDDDLIKGSVTAITDNKIDSLKFLQTIYGGFSYAIVIGDEGWHEQEIYYLQKPLFQDEKITKIVNPEIEIIKTDQVFTWKDKFALQKEIKEKIQPTHVGYRYRHYGGKPHPFSFFGIGGFGKTSSKKHLKNYSPQPQKNNLGDFYERGTIKPPIDD